MMKTILFLRHGKSDWDSSVPRDFDRPLTRRGKKASRAIGKLLSRLETVPDHILCSEAVRARQTLKQVVRGARWQQEGSFTAAGPYRIRIPGKNRPTGNAPIAESMFLPDALLGGTGYPTGIITGTFDSPLHIQEPSQDDSMRGNEAPSHEEVEVLITPALYDTDVETVLGLIRELPTSSDAVLLIGHEPTWSHTVSTLIGGGEVRFQTATLAAVELPSRSWKEVEAGAGVLTLLASPEVL